VAEPGQRHSRIRQDGNNFYIRGEKSVDHTLHDRAAHDFHAPHRVFDDCARLTNFARSQDRLLRNRSDNDGADYHRAASSVDVRGILLKLPFYAAGVERACAE
jgi:hypothetical protein